MSWASIRRMASNCLGVVGIDRYRRPAATRCVLRGNDDFFQLGIGVAGQHATGQQYRQGAGVCGGKVRAS